MPRFALLLFLVASAMPSIAAPPYRTNGPEAISVAQLEQDLGAAQGKSDAEVAQQLAGLELTERLSAARYARLRLNLPGEKSQQELLILADRSAFLDLPPAEIPDKAKPDAATQRQIMALTVKYVTSILQQLPNFFATRDTTSFEDRPQQDVQGETGLVSYSYLPLHVAGRSSRTVVYRDGQESVDKGAGKTGKQESRAQGLDSYGEFGPILSMVLLDAAQSKLFWSHWEQSADGVVGVFGYEVPAQKSHYWVQFCCVADFASGDPAHQFRERAGYRGEMTVDPATGTILRVTVDAELLASDPLSKAGMMVEYSAVEIGGKSFTCPVRSVSLSLVHNAHLPPGMQSAASYTGPLKVYLNDVAFTQYHRLGTEMRILAGDDQGAGGTQAAASPNAQPTAAAGTDAPPPAANNASAETAPAGEKAAAPAPVSTPATAEPEIGVEAASGIPDAPAGASAPPAGGFVLHVTSRLVDVGLVVVDKKGHPVKSLAAADFEVYDNGRKQQAKFFSEFSGGADAASLPASPSAGQTYSNQPASEAAALPSTQANATILLIDESHIAWSDLSHTRQEVLRFLNGLAPGERVGLYSMSGLGFRVLTEVTADRAAVIGRLNRWMPTAQAVVQAQEDETRNRQQFETVHNAADLNSVNGNQIDVPIAGMPIDPQLLIMGSDPARASLIILRSVARHLAALPGHKNLVWISSDNVLANWQDQAVSVDKNTNSIDSFALHAQEAMNDAHAAVYPFDVSQLEAGSIGADIQNRNVELAPAQREVTTPPRDMTAGRIKADMLQDLRPIQGPIRELAEATGGRTIRRHVERFHVAGPVHPDHSVVG